ncbi:NmrA family NAD(P)-binding protein [Burkholderia ambifaria]|uniref:NmrA family NAD(P)-binding protein n=1 Tax=Burkholderia ambifaria TaxID=152480 RepID=UPI001BA2AB54|nr:NmrA family NAD(P)-binding protein [Burkholderia ambifaria]MBR8256284.1 NmrA family NAD(P)-binding protein [Burkholderia ambifaria]
MSENLSKQETILITGATGRHGGTSAHVVDELLRSGHAVRVFARSESERTERMKALGVDIVLGDFTDRRSLVAALDGVTTATFTYPIAGGIVPAAATFASAAREKRNGLRIVVMSMAVAHPDSPSLLGRAQWLAEEIFQWAGLDVCVLRIAALFMENLATLHSTSIKANSGFANSFGHVNVPWISGVDAGRLMVAAVLRPTLFEGHSVHYPPGAEQCSHDEIALILSDVLGRPIRFNALTQTEWTEDILAQVQTDPDSMLNADMAKHISAVGAALANSKAPIRLPNPEELRHLTGAKPISVREFITMNRDLFVTG